jgi:putative colanic acid biosynthesis UDP-glucose lipid carrier transferase
MRVDSGKVRLTTLSNDDRVFPFGKFIRKAKIDEMPQAWNILINQMSVVGPRPEDEENADRICVGKYREILSVKPGLTSPASLYDYTHGELYCNELAYSTEFVPKKLELELYYVRNRSFKYDTKLVIRTAIVVVLKLCGRKEFAQPKEIIELASSNPVLISSSQFRT